MKYYKCLYTIITKYSVKMQKVQAISLSSSVLFKYVGPNKHITIKHSVYSWTTDSGKCSAEYHVIVQPKILLCDSLWPCDILSRFRVMTAVLCPRQPYWTVTMVTMAAILIGSHTYVCHMTWYHFYGNHIEMQDIGMQLVSIGY